MSEMVELLHYSEDDLLNNGGRVLHQFGVHVTHALHTHDFYELFLVASGCAVHVINKQTQIITEGSFVIIRPWDTHKYSILKNDDFELYSIGIPFSVFLRLCTYLNIDKKIFDEPTLPPHRLLSAASLSDVQKKLSESDHIEDPKAGFLYMLSVFPYLVGIFLAAPTSKSTLPLWFSDLLKKMEEPENLIVGLPRLLTLANFSQEHLNRSFRRYLGITPTMYINAKRLELATDFLLTSDIPIIEISGQCGFNSQSHFYRLFTERYGCSPASFRKNFKAHY